MLEAKIESLIEAVTANSAAIQTLSEDLMNLGDKLDAMSKGETVQVEPITDIDPEPTPDNVTEIQPTTKKVEIKDILKLVKTHNVAKVTLEELLAKYDAKTFKVLDAQQRVDVFNDLEQLIEKAA